ncbi:MAG TPA: hypothetical protein DG048_24515 [Pseudoalteromonas sp.]|nr:hypothetical protein [Pseudoalteromonas sp.]
MDKTSFAALNKNNQRKVVLFGCGKVAEKSLKKLGEDKVAFVVDNSSAAQKSLFNGLKVESPNTVTKEYFVLICSTDIANISAQLTRLGLLPNLDFSCSPILNDILAVSELEQLNCKFYFTSGTVASEDTPWGGGLYVCNVVGTTSTVERLYSGTCYGAISHNGHILFVDSDHGVHSYCNGEIKHLFDLPVGARAHGLSYNRDYDRFYVSCSNRDCIIELDSRFNLTRTFFLSGKYEKTKEASHHINDNYAIGDSLYATMFSSTGNWKKDVFDGCVAEFDLNTGERLPDPVKDLYMPHNIKFFNGSMHVLDSLPGHLRFSNMSIQGTFPAFTRGLDYKFGLYFIGQSKNRNYSKIMGVSNNISIDCGVIVFNAESKVSRFIPLPYETGEIHAIVVED